MTGAPERLVALLGDPVDHSLSPAMHNAAFRHLGINMHYMAFRVTSDHFEQAVKGLAAIDAAGANVTVPHKEKAFRICDVLDPSVQQVKSVNTLLFSPDGVEGYNTDLFGVKNSVKQLCSWGRIAFVLGAGGAARSVVCALGQMKFPSVYIMNRTIEKALALSEDIAPFFPDTSIEVLPWGEFPEKETDLFVNASSLGLDKSPWPEGLVFHFLESLGSVCVLDMVYRKQGSTSLVDASLERRMLAMDGREVLIQQGTAAFELFTGRMAPEEVMRASLDWERAI